MKEYYKKLIHDDYEFCIRMSAFLTEAEIQYIARIETGKNQLYSAEARARLRAIVERLCREII